MPIQAPQWTEFLTCPVCCNEFDGNQRSPISLACAHTVCKTCLANLHKKQCPFDQTVIKSEVSGLPVNGALLQLVGGHATTSQTDEAPSCLSSLSSEELEAYFKAKTAVEELALYLKPISSGCGSGGGVVTRPMQRKLVTLVNCQLAEEEGRCRAMRAARSLGDRTVTELILHHQNPQHLSANLWAAVRARGCQFLGPAMQEEVLKLVLLALEDGTALSRKVLVMFVVQRLEPHFPQASKTSIGHVVQLLYRASCFKVSKREGDSSLMQLKEEFRGYEALRREHDAQIVQIATEAGLRIAPDQWSALLYGDTTHKSHMQSIMDKLQSPQSFAQSVQELVIALQRTSDPGSLSSLRPHLELLAAIDPNPEVVAYSMVDVAQGVEACRVVVAGLVEFMRVHGNNKASGGCTGAGGSPAPGEHTKYKVSLCRDLIMKGTCPRGSACTFAHSGDELDKFRSKNRKTPRNSINKEEEHQHDDIMFCNEGSIDYAAYPLVAQNAAYAANQQAYMQSPTTPYPTEIYNSPTHGVVLTANTPFQEYPPSQAVQPQDANRLHQKQIWRPHNIHNSKRVASSLAVLHHRKQEILNKLEKVVARCNNNPVRNDVQSNATNYSVWNSSNVMHSPLIEPQANSISGARPMLFRSDSILTEEEFIPFDPPVISKFGPISRDGTKFGANTFSDTNSSRLCNPVTWVFNAPQGSFPAHVMQPSREGYITVSPGMVDPLLLHPRPSQIVNPDLSASKEFFVESLKMKHQLRTLEKKINDLKLAAENPAALSEGEKLSQELQIIEQGIREREKQLRLNQLGTGTTTNWNGETWPVYRSEEYLAQEDSYEAGIANDIRELELRWEYELEEQEKRWSSEEESTKK
ncbi:RING finger and CCCH-type zinc finger domain-containing protein roquin isoform X2 [Rhodnius prolixus]|uniref:RING finger and CCCH-type zinc finger domain-containing protein roquin isoform X2 n=1 Tax=Rhodnius prolixus TaxID=13249 RepID=UPI003D18BFE5